jgi:hypothetical protein
VATAPVAALWHRHPVTEIVVDFDYNWEWHDLAPPILDPPNSAHLANLAQNEADAEAEGEGKKEDDEKTQPLRPYRRRFNEPPSPPRPAWQTAPDFASAAAAYDNAAYAAGRHHNPWSELETQLRRYHIEKFIRDGMAKVPLPSVDNNTYHTRQVEVVRKRMREASILNIIDGMVEIDNECAADGV